MKTEKFRLFLVTFATGEKLQVKAANKVTESYFLKLAYHCANIQYKRNFAPCDALSCTGIITNL